MGPSSRPGPVLGHFMLNAFFFFFAPKKYFLSKDRLIPVLSLS